MDLEKYIVNGETDPRMQKQAQPEQKDWFADVSNKASKGLVDFSSSLVNPLQGLQNVYNAGEQMVKGTADMASGAWNSVSNLAQGNFNQAGEGALQAIKGAVNVGTAPARAMPIFGQYMGNAGEGVAAGMKEAAGGIGDVAQGLYGMGKTLVTNPGSQEGVNSMAQVAHGVARVGGAPFVAGMEGLPTQVKEGIGAVAMPAIQGASKIIDDAITKAGVDPQSEDVKRLKQAFLDVGAPLLIGGAAKALPKIAGMAGGVADDLSQGIKGGISDLKGVAQDFKSNLPTFSKKPVAITTIDDALSEGAKIGLQPKDIRNIVTASDEVKDLMRKQFNIAESSKDATGRIVPIQAKEIAGKQFVQGAEVLNGKNIGFIKAKKQVLDGLGDTQLSLDPARSNMVKNLEKYGIKIDPSTAELDFTNSQFSQSAKSQKLINNMYGKVLDNASLTAKEIDDMKKAFGEEIFSGTQSGVYTPAVEKLGQDFYFGLDKSISDVSPAYRKLNANISEISGVIKEVNKLLGNKNINEIDLRSLKASEVLNRLSTNMAGNADPIVKKFITTVQKHGGKLNMDIINRTTSIAQLLEELMPTQTSSITSAVKKGTIQAGKEVLQDGSKAMFGGTMGRLEVASKYLSGAQKDITTQQIEFLKKLLGSKKSAPIVKVVKSKSPIITTPKVTKVSKKPPVIKSEKVNNFYTTLKAPKIPKIDESGAIMGSPITTKKVLKKEILTKKIPVIKNKKNAAIDTSLMSSKQKADLKEWTGLLEKYKGDDKKIALIKQQISDLETVAKPPKIMYHGTSETNAKLIIEKGFKSGKELGKGEKRQYISLGSRYTAGTYTRGAGANTKIPIDISNLRLKPVAHTDPLRIGIENGSVSIPDGYDGLQIMFKGNIAEVLIPAEVATKHMKTSKISTITSKKQKAK